MINDTRDVMHLNEFKVEWTLKTSQVQLEVKGRTVSAARTSTAAQAPTRVGESTSEPILN